jgi:hypothetical protein
MVTPYYWRQHVRRWTNSFHMAIAVIVLLNQFEK